MKKFKSQPREQLTDVKGGEDVARYAIGDDVEGHASPDAPSFLPGMPGTGGDALHRPISGGEIADDDVEGHSFGHTKGERFLPGMPGTGGDEIA